MGIGLAAVVREWHDHQDALNARLDRFLSAMEPVRSSSDPADRQFNRWSRYEQLNLLREHDYSLRSYYVDTYYDPYGYTYVYQAAAAPVPTADPSPGSNVPDLLDKAHRAANAIDVGVRAALDPIKELLKTAPTQTGDTVVYGPANHGYGNYQFTLRRVSASDRRFGWKLEDISMPDNRTYTMINVGDGTGGGMMKNPMPGSPATWLAYVNVDSGVGSGGKRWAGQYGSRARRQQAAFHNRQKRTTVHLFVIPFRK